MEEAEYERLRYQTSRSAFLHDSAEKWEKFVARGRMQDILQALPAANLTPDDLPEVTEPQQTSPAAAVATRLTETAAVGPSPSYGLDALLEAALASKGMHSDLVPTPQLDSEQEPAPHVTPGTSSLSTLADAADDRAKEKELEAAGPSTTQQDDIPPQLDTETAPPGRGRGRGKGRARARATSRGTGRATGRARGRAGAKRAWLHETVSS